MFGFSFSLFKHLLDKNLWFGSTTNITFPIFNFHNFLCFRIIFLVFDYTNCFKFMSSGTKVILCFWIHLNLEKLSAIRGRSGFISFCFFFSRFKQTFLHNKFVIRIVLPEKLINLVICSGEEAFHLLLYQTTLLPWTEFSSLFQFFYPYNEYISYIILRFLSQ